jgi:uncharacterized protein
MPEAMSGMCWDLALSGKIRLTVSETILAEYEGVLRRPKFAITPKHIAKSMRLLRSVSHIVNPQRELRVAHDPEHNRFLECAEAARADYLVTGNKSTFPGIGVRRWWSMQGN